MLPKSFLFLLIILSPFIPINCSLENNPPAVFVFGDSLSDPGNNLVFSAYYSPYGIDFPNGTTGRWTNGLIFADLIASELGLPFPAAYRKKPRSLTGYNYASGGCGILPNNDTSILACMGLDIQINNFNKTIVEELGQVFENPTELNEYLSKSIFIIWAGTNDYFLNYFKNLSPNYTSEEYAQHLIDTLSNYLKVLHSLGARKFLVLELGPIGCVPFNRLNGGHEGTWCDESKNKNATIFNGRLASMLQISNSIYLDSYFILGKIYDLSDDAFKNPSKYGLTNVSHPCCTVGPLILGNISCIPFGKPCDTREQYLFFDGVHPTEASLRVLASKCFNDSSVCVPYNIQQLVQLKTNSYKPLYSTAARSTQLHGAT